MAKAPPETLADLLLEASYKPPTQNQWPHDLLINARMELRSARRFVLNREASSFLSDLSNAVFLRKSPKICERIFDQMLSLARLPHAATWIEYDAAAEGLRTAELVFADPYEFVDSGDVIHNASKRSYEERKTRRIGLLAHVAPECETTFMGTIYIKQLLISNSVNLLWFPFRYVWSTDGALGPPYDSLLNATKQLSRGQKFIWESIAGFKGVNEDTKSLNMLTVMPFVDRSGMGWSEHVVNMIVDTLGQFPGLFRRFLALLATINDIPVIATEHISTRGFMARHSYYRYLNHTVLTLNLPKGKDPRQIARNIVAAAHRRAHQVRGHWRRDWRHEGQRIWIHEHIRGDAKLGFVTHDYNVVHEQ